MLQTPFQEKTLLDRVLVHFELNVYLKPFPQANNHNKNLFQEDLIYQERCADREGLKKREIFKKKREIFKRKLKKSGIFKRTLSNVKREKFHGRNFERRGRSPTVLASLRFSWKGFNSNFDIFRELLGCFLTIAIIQDDVSQPVLGVWWDHGVRQRGVRPRPHRDRLGHDQGHQVHHGDHSHQHKHIIR